MAKNDRFQIIYTPVPYGISRRHFHTDCRNGVPLGVSGRENTRRSPRNTGVLSLQTVSGYAGGLTPLLDETGKPMRWSREDPLPSAATTRWQGIRMGRGLKRLACPTA